MIRIFKILFFLAAITAVFLIFDKNSFELNLFFLNETPLTLPAYQLYIILIMIGIVVGYLVSLKSVFSYRAEIKKLIINNKDLSDELDSLRNVAFDDDISFEQED